MSMQNKPILIMAGGTGGHIYPALAIASRLKEKNIPFLWLGTKAGLESKIVPKHGIPLLTIAVSGVRGKGIVRWVKAPFSLCLATLHAIILLLRYKPAIVLGMGGYVSAPGGFAAWLMRIPLCLHEQNAVAGLTNRLLVPLAHTVMEAFPETFAPTAKTVHTGNPVRKELLCIDAPQERSKNRLDDSLRVLVLGGSLGARTLNETMPNAISLLKDKVSLQVKHQTGSQHLAATQDIYQSLAVSAELFAYIDDVQTVYAWADIVLCRAGAMTVAEISAVGIASILVPYPYAVDDHQTANAMYLSDAGAAILIHEKELSGQKLASLLQGFARKKSSLYAMAKLCLSLSKPMATEHVVEFCMRASK